MISEKQIKQNIREDILAHTEAYRNCKSQGVETSPKLEELYAKFIADIKIPSINVVLVEVYI